MLRGAASLTVAAFHIRQITWIGLHAFWHIYGWSWNPLVLLGYATFPLVWGAIGVPIFFVISGYCIHRRQAYSISRLKTHNLQPANFLAKRFVRIYPVLLGALILTFLCDHASALFVSNNDNLGDTSAATFLINLFSLQGVAGRWYGSNEPLWTLSIEVQFYASYPLLLFLMSRLGRNLTILMLCAISGASFSFLQMQGYVLFTSYYACWYLGVLVAECETTTTICDTLSSKRWRAILTGLSLALLSAGCVVSLAGGPVAAYFSFQLWAVAFTLFLLRRIGYYPPTKPNIAAKVLGSIGKFSFSLYIIHTPIIVLIFPVLFKLSQQRSILPAFLILASVIGCAIVFFLLIERPALTFAQRLKAKTYR